MKGKQAMIKNIVFDIGNVLIHFDWDGFLRRNGADEEDVAVVGKQAIHSPLWRTLDENIVPFDTVRTQLMEAVGEKRAHWIQMMLEWYEGMCITAPYSLPWLNALRARGYKLYVLSNFSEHGFQRAAKRLPFLNYLDGYLISYEVKLMKPSPDIYMALCQKYNLNPEECLMIDDLKENVEGARSCGFSGLVFESTKTPEIFQHKLDLILKENGLG